MHAIRTLYGGGEAVKLLRRVRQRSALCWHDDENIAAVIEQYWPHYDVTTRGALCRYLRLSARATLRERWAEVKALADALLERKAISGDEARSILLEARGAFVKS
jgi:hypothetical protein